MGKITSLELFSKQPTPDFINELKKPMHLTKPENFGKRKCSDGEINLNGMYLDIIFPDEEALLETAYADFNNFLRVYEIGGGKYPVKVRQNDNMSFEEHTLVVSENECIITAADTEGVRRALVMLEDMLIESETPFLYPSEKTRRPVIKTRITRGYFSPTNRPPKNIDELWDDVDYYPDEYLNRLAHDGNNGIWIYTHFSDLIPSKIITAYGKESARRIEKLKSVVKKCRRYGIKVYIFAVEPGQLSAELEKEYPELCGEKTWNGLHTFCTHSKKGEQYLTEATQYLFSAVPELGGYIDITSGERITNCAQSDYKQCPICSEYTRGEIVAHTADLIKEGMRRAGAKGEFISWTYNHREWDFEDIKDYVKRAPSDVMLMQNFDDCGYAEQLGKKRFAIDYWLSYVGPSAMFEETAKCANLNGKHIYAKMQVCCSHELATVPYIPVPGLLFEKYKGAKKYNVEGILQCWYFGNYPSVMSKAAGELSFLEDFSSEDDFLLHLAGILYGKSNANAIVNAWKLFGKGYSNYPLNIMFSYYGPMHDSVVWKLHLIPKNISPARTWLLLEDSEGDRICDALFGAHTLAEALELSEQICRNWKKGMEYLPNGITGEHQTVCEALDVLFDSGRNILKFYKLREDLGLMKGDLMQILNTMKDIVNREIKNSTRMIELCNRDTRLGYHSEAEGFKFYPQKIKERIDSLQVLLKTEFAEVEQRIKERKAPLAYYIAEGEDTLFIGTDVKVAQRQSVGNSGAFCLTYDEKSVYLDIECNKSDEVMFCFEGKIMDPATEIIINDGKFCETYGTYMYRQLLGDDIKKELSNYTLNVTDKGYHISADRAHIGWTDDGKPFKLAVKIGRDFWVEEENPFFTLGRWAYSAGQFGFVKAKQE